MLVTILHGDAYSLSIYPDLFNPHNVVILVMHDDPNQPVETFVVPKAMLAQAAGLNHAKS